jgi:hypothetical protein
MSKFHFRVLAVANWLLALCFGIACAAYYERYSLFRDGTAVQATVTELVPQAEDVWVAITFEDGGKEQRRSMRLPDAAGLEPGSTVEVLLHANNGEARLASTLSDELPTIPMVAGLVLSIALGVYLWMVPTRQARRRAARTSPLDVLVDAAARTRNVAVGVGTFLLLAGAGFAIVPFFDRESGLGAAIFLWVLAALTLGLAVMSFARAIALRDPRRNEVPDLILHRPGEIAWFYVSKVTSENVEASEALSVEIWKADGKKTMLTLVREDLDGVLGEIASRAPHAQHGYDREIERLYREHPGRWRPGTSVCA